MLLLSNIYTSSTITNTYNSQYLLLTIDSTMMERRIKAVFGRPRTSEVSRRHASRHTPPTVTLLEGCAELNTPRLVVSSVDNNPPKMDSNTWTTEPDQDAMLQEDLNIQRRKDDLTPPRPDVPPRRCLVKRMWKSLVRVKDMNSMPKRSQMIRRRRSTEYTEIDYRSTSSSDRTSRRRDDRDWIGYF